MAAVDKQEWPPLLAAGFHNLDENARHRLCVQRFADSITRPRIMRNLEDKIATSINMLFQVRYGLMAAS